MNKEEPKGLSKRPQIRDLRLTDLERRRRWSCRPRILPGCAVEGGEESKVTSGILAGVTEGRRCHSVGKAGDLGGGRQAFPGEESSVPLWGSEVQGSPLLHPDGRSWQFHIFPSAWG